MIRACSDEEEAARECVQAIEMAAQEAVNRRDRFTLALSGGRTPTRTLQLLGERSVRIPWDRTLLFWVDERSVPPDHPDSNYGSVRTLLLPRVPIPSNQVYPMDGGIHPRLAAERYETLLKRLFDLGKGGVPCMDLALLGLGADGHTASLFPNAGFLEERKRLVTGGRVPGVKHSRITLTLRTLNGAREALFLVTGKEKAHAVASVHSGVEPHLVAGRIRPRNGKVSWVLDPGAASRLEVDGGTK